MPMFNQDVFDAGMPEPAKRLRAEIAAADGVLIASPEYNFSLSAALKNAIDWASRPPNQSWQDKPVAMFSASGGPLGGARVQYDIRRILGQLWAHVLPRPEVFIGARAGQVRRAGQDHRRGDAQIPHRPAGRVRAVDHADEEEVASEK